MTKKIIIFMSIFLFAAFGFVGYFYVVKDKSIQNFLPFYEKADVSGSVKEELKNKNETETEKIVKVPIFIYHSVAPYYPSESNYKKRFSVEPDVFEKQMSYLKNHGYSVVSFDDLINYFLSGAPLPEKSVILTFDDGWENQYKYAFPILKKYNYTATFFVFTNAIGRERFLTWSQIKEFVAAGMTIGDHTKSHPYLHKITDENELRKEIIGSREILERELGKKIDIFAYPFGRYNQEIVDVLKENGFRAARTDGYFGTLHTQSSLFTLKSIEAENDLAKFIEELSIKQ